jgi:pimeloyl-ACP methyl ester carboxylesterase
MWTARRWRSFSPRRIQSGSFALVLDVDVRSALTTIQAPTLIVHRTADLDDETDTSAAEIAQFMAARIAGSRVLEVGRFDWLPFEEIGEFVVEAWEQRAVERRRGSR